MANDTTSEGAKAMSAVERIEAGLAELGTAYQVAFRDAPTETSLRAEHARILGKKGELTALLTLLRDVPAEARPGVGAKVNAFRASVETAFATSLACIEESALERELNGPPHDLTLPGRLSFGRGHAHPVLVVRDEMLAVFRELGFQSVDGPEIELEQNNFEKLGFPPDHPATDMQDSFWIEPGVLLRTHTSNVQIREMSTRKPPMAVVSAGAVYRRDDDVTHSPMFHQIEGFLIDEGVTLAHLRGVLTAFAERMYGPGTPTRFRPSYFPFVEPGVEVDVGCVFCSVKDGTRATCRVCKATGWLEIGGSGMIHPVVFRNTGIDPERFTGFAFGMGVDRIAMLKYGIPNIRVLFDNDPRFLAQF